MAISGAELTYGYNMQTKFTIFIKCTDDLDFNLLNVIKEEHIRIISVPLYVTGKYIRI